MKRSTKVALTLLIPAMAAFGCSKQSPQVGAPVVGGETAVDCDIPAKPGEPEKPRCSTVANTTPHARGGYYGRGWTGYWFGGPRTNIAPTTISQSGSATPSTGSSVNNGVVRGGFGTTGSHLSGGS